MDRHRTKSSHRDRDRERDYERGDRDKDRDRHREKQYREEKSSSSKRHHLPDIESENYHHRDKDRERDREKDRHSRREPEPERVRENRRDDRERDRHRGRDSRNNDNNDNGRDNRDRERENEYNPKMICKFGEECRRENFYHFKEYAHTHLETLLEEILKSQKESGGSKSSRIELPKNYVPKIDKSLILDQLNHLKNCGFRLPSEAELKRRKDWETLFNPNGSSSASANDNNFNENNNHNYSPPTRIKREKRPVEDEDSKYGKKYKKEGEESEEDKPVPEKEKPNFGLSGKLTEETNTFRGVVIKYSEPQEARKPAKIRWRLYPFKGKETLPVMYIHRQSAYLLGRERKIADIPIDHPSCSKQHAVIQYRLMPYKRPDGSSGRRIKPYIIDLESGNGTFVNGEKIETKRYVELFEKDVLKFGFSSREYVLLHEKSKADDPEDDEPMGNTPEVDEKVRIKVEQEQD